MTPQARMKAMKKFSRLIDKQNNGCWVWAGNHNSDGYGRFGAGGAVDKAHRQAWRLFRGEIPAGSMVLHTCDVKDCVNPAHLYIGNHQMNMQDKAARGRDKRRKLSNDQVGEALLMMEAGASLKDLAIAYRVHPSLMSKIRSGTRRQYAGKLYKAGGKSAKRPE